MKALTILLLSAGMLLASCGGHSSAPTTTVSGSYEFIVTSNVTGGVTLVESNLTANGSQSSASGASQVQVLSFEAKNWYLNGVCSGATPGDNSVSANIRGTNVGLTLNDGGSAISGQGVLTGSTITGNYAVSGSTCPDLQNRIGYPAGYDSGGIVGKLVPALAGTFSGLLDIPDGIHNAALTLTESPDYNLSASLALSGPVDNGTFTLSGTTIGNVMFVSGQVNSSTLTLLGYFDRAGTYTKFPNSLLVFNYDTQSNAGLLVGQ